MTLYLFDNVFGLNLTFESTEGILQGFALLQSDFCHAPLLQIITAMLVFGTYVLCAPLVIRTFAFTSLQNRSYSSTWLPWVDCSALSSSFAPRLKSAACSAACLRSSAISSIVPATVPSCFR